LITTSSGPFENYVIAVTMRFINILKWVDNSFYAGCTLDW